MEYKPFKINKNMIEGMKKAFPYYEQFCKEDSGRIEPGAKP